MRWVLVFVLAGLTCLLIRSASVELASDYTDPIARVTAQDEALYAATAIRLSHQGDWLTPVFMGRYALYKPPMLYWLSAISAKTLGISRFALRFPVALISALGAGLVFLWVWRLRGWPAGVCAGLLLISNHLWHVLCSLCMTDGLLVAFYTAALYVLFRDPTLGSVWALWGFAGAVAAAILTKGVAGTLPLAILGCYWIFSPGKLRPAFARVLTAGGLAALLAAPWFVYQMLVHGRWFWAEHIAVEIMGFGAGAPPQVSEENRFWFYLGRLVNTDPVLPLMALFALPGLIAAVRKRSPAAILLSIWLVFVAATTLGWHYRNISYLLPLVPALAILVPAYGPRVSTKTSYALIAVLVCAFVVKTVNPQHPWGLVFDDIRVQPVAPLLSNYCDLGRGNDLIQVGLEDDLVGAALPLYGLHYALISPGPVSGRYSMDFASMGIAVSATQFNALPQWKQQFRQSLREWGLNSEEPIGTLILMQSADELSALIAAHPDSDFLLSTWYLEAIRSAAEATHVLVPAGAHHILLLAGHSRTRLSPPAWSCHL